MANSSFDLSSFMPEQELVELLWEDGQIVMQGQSNRTRKSSIGTDSTLNGRVEDTDDVTIAKLGQTGAAAHDLLRSVPSAMISQEDEATHWMNYPIDDDDALQNDYCSEFFSEITGAMSSLTNTNTSINQSAKDSHAFRSSPRVSDPTKPRYVHQIFPETARSKTVDLDGSKRIQKVSQKNHGAGVLNFSHFSRPAALVKANLHSIERLQESSNGKSMVNRPSFAASENKARSEGERKVEAVVVSSSTSNDGKQKSKKRTREGDESGEQSDELDNESFAVKELSSLRGASGKRSRAAEVHNLSERRRRDRINEKMKALQELIPNCNKVDKASMLDEAIEYLKTLQLQVQMMSMGSGLCMAPMMLPAGMNLQHLRSSQMASFSPLGVGMGIGMGMGLGFGMGMIDLNGSPGLVPVSPQFPCPSVPGVSGLYGMPAQRLPVSASQPSFFNSQRSSLHPWQVLDPAPSSSQNKQQTTQTSQAACPKDGEEMHGSRGSAANPVFDGGSIKGGG